MRYYAVLPVMLLAGCASLPDYIKAEPEEIEQCKVEGCSVWTDKELQFLIDQMFKRGYIAGKRST